MRHLFSSIPWLGLRLVVILLALFLAPFVRAQATDDNGSTIFLPSGTPYQITGRIVNSSNNPIAGVRVSGYVVVNGTNYQASSSKSDTNGDYVLNVSNGFWGVAVNCNGSNSLGGLGYYCVDDEQVNISGTNGVANFIVPCCGAIELDGHVRDNHGNPLVNVEVQASSPAGYPSQDFVTDANGFYEFIVGDGNWNLSVNCTNLNTLGFACVSDETDIPVDGSANVQIDFAPQPIAGPPAPFFTGEASVGPNAYYLRFPDNTVFGYFNLANFPYLYHYDMGFSYFFDANNSAHGCYLYDFTSGHFWYTDPSVFPYLYDFSLSAWLYYFPDTSRPDHYLTDQMGGTGKRVFVNLSNGQYIFD